MSSQPDTSNVTNGSNSETQSFEGNDRKQFPSKLNKWFREEKTSRFTNMQTERSIRTITSKVIDIFLELRCMKRVRTQRISSDIQSIEAVSEETVGQHSHNNSCYHLAHEAWGSFEVQKAEALHWRREANIGSGVPPCYLRVDRVYTQTMYSLNKPQKVTRYCRRSVCDPKLFGKMYHVHTNIIWYQSKGVEG